jgi:S-adenosylmethionine:tRNA ribosyltransferase-isomerase
MKLSDFDFDLPLELIAQEPLERRGQSNLIISSENNKIIKFIEIIDYLNPGDLMVFNDTKVINAKLTLDKSGKAININLNKPSSIKNSWRAFAKPAKKLVIGDEFFFDNHKLVITNKFEFGEIEVKFVLDGIEIFTFLDQYGEVPLPLYIKRQKANKEDVLRYQTVYSLKKGSVAAPTAGLHFTSELLEKIRAKNIEIQFVTLHVGAGTFLPVKTENISDHKMHSEYFNISSDTAKAINKAKSEGRRIISVGTTALRSLESCSQDGKLYPDTGETDIFITPGYKFQIIDSLITNFHLPKSTLFMLVCAFSGAGEIKNLYKYAIDNKMRFFSYGDAMMLHNKSHNFL